MHIFRGRRWQKITSVSLPVTTGCSSVGGLCGGPLADASLRPAGLQGARLADAAPQLVQCSVLHLLFILVRQLFWLLTSLCSRSEPLTIPGGALFPPPPPGDRRRLRTRVEAGEELKGLPLRNRRLWRIERHTCFGAAFARGPLANSWAARTWGTAGNR